MSISAKLISRSGRFTAAFLFTAALAACEGPEGPAGAPGPQGPPGAPGEGGLDPSLTTADKAFTGLGGEGIITGLTSFSVQAEGTNLMIGENFDPEDGSATIGAFTSTTTYDLANDAFRIDWKRDFFFFGASREYSEIVNADLGYVQGSDLVFAPDDPAAQAAMPSDRMAAIRKEQRLLNPLLIMRDVAATPTIATEGGPALLDGVVHERLVIEDAVSDITLYVNPNTGLITKLETWENDQLRRDVLLEVFYADWQTNGQVQYPGAVFLALDGELLHAETRTFTANATIEGDALAIPSLTPAPEFVQADADRGMRSHQFLQQFASLGVPITGVQSTIVAIPLDNADPAQAKLFHLTGGTHHSLAIKQENGVVIAEAPLYPERTKAILDWVETQFPGTPVTHVIITHHHFDHTAGLREFVAAGAQIVVHQEARVFFEGIFRAPSTIVPDTLQTAPVQPKITSVSDDGVFDLLDPAGARVCAFPMNTSHAKDMMMIYVEIPGSQTVFISDIFSPGFPANPAAAGELLAAIQDRELTVAKIAGGHGMGTATLAELDAIVNPPPAN
jgi:glyoxylase-like metal-dependent hydrolase (beta-lactamase superfamily II)